MLKNSEALLSKKFSVCKLNPKSLAKFDLMVFVYFKIEPFVIMLVLIFYEYTCIFILRAFLLSSTNLSKLSRVKGNN